MSLLVRRFARSAFKAVLIVTCVALCLCQMFLVVFAVLAVAAAQVYYTSPYASSLYRSSPYVYSTGYVSPYSVPYAYSGYRYY